MAIESCDRKIERIDSICARQWLHFCWLAAVTWAHFQNDVHTKN